MAAYAALVSLMNDLELIPNHPIHSFSFDTKQITSLSQTVSFLVDFLESYDSHGCTREEAVEVLESRIASAAHEAHDVIESHLVDQIISGFTVGGKARSCFLLDLQKASESMDFVKRKAIQFKTKSGVKMEQSTYSPPASSQPLTPEKNFMVGFDDALIRLVEMLVEGHSGERVIPIVGMGGTGKTTLARNVYNDLLIHHHFDVRLWATISQEYSVENILTQLLSRRSATGRNVSGLGEELHKKLWGRRFFIVLDDMWGVQAWEEIQMFLPDNGNGRRVIVTTRLSNLAAHLSSFSPFEMNFLNEDKSWELFCQRAFGEEDCSVELEVGKRIVKRCRGLPLSTVVIGGHLRKSLRAIEYWEKVASFMNPISSLGEDEQCLNIINLSYHHLPIYLKPCLLYMGIYPENGWIDASELLKFWIAEGFVRPKKGLSLEEVAEDYLKDLIDRNLIFVHERRWNGKVKFCGVHDIVRELCLKVGKKDKFMCVVEDNTKAIDMDRRVVIPMGIKKSDITCAPRSAPLVRCLIRRSRKPYFDQMSVELRSLRLLRVSINVDNMYLKTDGICLPHAHFQQANLRYLAFSCNEKPNSMRRFTERPYLPSSISLFWNLQTLAIINFSVQITVPYEIWEMPQLRHLKFIQVYLPNPLPSDRSNQDERVVLRNLHTLEGVVNFKLTEEVCKRMPNLKKLFLKYNDLPGDCEASSYYGLRNLACLSKLESLTCYFGDDLEWRDVGLSLRLPSSLEELSLWRSHLRWKDLTMMIKSLPRLGSLEFNSIRGREWDLVEEEFPHLKVLAISRSDDLIYWNANSSHFPVLEILHVLSLPKLSEIPFDFGEIPTLKHINLQYCNASAAISAMRIVVERENLGNQDLQLDVNFLEMEEVERFKKTVQEEGLTTHSLCVYYRFDKIQAF